MRRKSIVYGWLKIVFGLLVFALGVHLTIRANLGLAPWDCLGMGISYHTPLNYGLSMTIMSVLILGIDVLLKEKIGFGTIIDALLTGNLVQMYNDLNPFPLNSRLWVGILAMLALVGRNLKESRRHRRTAMLFCAGAALFMALFTLFYSPQTAYALYLRYYALSEAARTALR